MFKQYMPEEFATSEPRMVGKFLKGVRKATERRRLRVSDKFFKILRRDERFTIQKKLGNGAFGTVYLALDKTTEKNVALKHVVITRQNITEVQHEITFLARMHHENIAKMVLAFRSSLKSAYIAMELCTGGELFGAIVKHKKLTEGIVKQIAYEILSALQHAHSRQIAHLDLKPENVLLAAPWNGEPDTFPPIKIVDWGLASDFSDFDRCPCDVKGSPNYMAPEVFLGDYNEKADLWSLGVMVYVMMTGNFPFSGATLKELVNAIVNTRVVFYEEEWAESSEVSKSFSRYLMTKNPTLRPSAEGASKHKWFSSGVDAARSEFVLARLRQYAHQDKLKRIILYDIIKDMETEAIKQVARKFRDIAGSKSELSFEDMRGAVLDLIMSVREDSELSAIVRDMDLNDSHTIDVDEFIVAMMGHHYNTRRQTMLFFNTERLEEVLTPSLLGTFFDDVEKGARAFKEMDKNNNGTIEMEEFVNWMLSEN